MTYMSTAERLVKLHDTMCDNIEAMGGTVDPTKTLIEIAGEILNIPPVPVGVSIDTATTCAADKATTSINSPVVFTGKVSAYHDDTTSADVDLIGYLKGATVKFYNGQTLLGSTTTDNNGEYSFSYTPTVAGELSVIAMFEAIEDYKQSSSTAVVITVSSYSDIVMSADKPILSYADGDKATLYAQLVDENDTPLAIEGVTLTFKKDSTILGTANTDSTGLATLVDGYTSQGVGDVTLSVTDGTFLTKTFTVKDIYFYDDGTSSAKASNYDLANAFKVNGGSKGTLSITNDGTQYHISNSDNNYKAIPIPLLSSIKVPFKLSCKITNNDVGLFAENGSVQFLNKVSTYARIVDAHKTNSSWNQSERMDGVGSDTEYTLELTANNGTLTHKIFDGTTEIYSRTKTSSTYNNTSNNVNFGLIMERYGIKFKEVMIELL